MSHFKANGIMSDLDGSCISYRTAMRNIPTTELESKFPFVISYRSEIDGVVEKQAVFSIYREESNDWYVSLNGHSNGTDKRMFSLTVLQKDEDHVGSYHEPKGHDTISSLLSPFINESDEFTGSVVAIDAKGNVVKDLTSIDEFYDLNSLLEQNELHDEAEKFGFEYVAISYQYLYANAREFALLDIKNSRVHYNSIGVKC